MKQTIRIKWWITGLALLLSMGLRAQTDGQPKSRLEMGRKPVSAPRVVTTKTFSFLSYPQVTSLDRAVTVRKNAVLNDYFRTTLLSAAPARSSARTAAPETTAVAITTEARQAGPDRNGATDARKQPDDRMFANEKISVSNLYPNPVVNDNAEIDYQILGNVNEAKLLIRTLLGVPVSEYVLDRNERKLRIATREFSNGIYFYILSLDGKNVATKKLLVRHQ